MPSNTITPPKNVVPVGRLTIGGQTYDVAQHPEFVRFFFDLFRRLGGSAGPSNEALQVQIDGLLIDTAVAPALSQEAPPAYADFLMPPAYEPMATPDAPSVRLEALEAQLAQLARAINDLQQGTQL